MHVGDHAALRRQVGGVAGLPVGKRQDVVGHEALQPGAAIAAGHPEDPSVRSPHHACRRPECPVAFQGKHVLSRRLPF